MAFRIGRTLSPAASPIYLRDILSGTAGLFRSEKTVTKFEAELRDHYQVRHCFTVSSGKTALTVILQALKEMSPGRDEVLIPAFTCYSVPSAIVRAGLKIRLCDLDNETFDFDYGQLSSIVSACRDRLLCVVPVHLFGIPADIERLRSIVNDSAIVIIEDAAQAMGGEHKKKKLGTIGDAGFFSLGRGKALSTVEGGIILTSRKDIAENITRVMEKIPNYSAIELAGLLLYAFALRILLIPSLFWLPKALPFLRLGETIFDPHFKMRRLSPFQAGLALEWENKLKDFKRFRAENVQAFLNNLETIGLKPAWGNQRPLPDLLRFPLSIESVRKREFILLASERMGLGIARTYPDSVDRIPDLKPGFVSNHFPVARENAVKLLTLPVHPHTTRKDREKIIDLLAQTNQI
jgi:perosamine synthetase